MPAIKRIAVVWNIPIVCNRASADFIFSSPLMNTPYLSQRPDYEAYQNRTVPTETTVVAA